MDTDIFLAQTADAERKFLQSIAELEEHLFAAMARREPVVTLALPPLTWLAILDEIRDRRPRNYSRLLADDTIDRLNAAIDRVHDEANYMVTAGVSVAARMNRRDASSPALRRAMQERQGQPRPPDTIK